MAAHRQAVADEAPEDSYYAGLGYGMVGYVVLDHREDFAG